MSITCMHVSILCIKIKHKNDIWSMNKKDYVIDSNTLKICGLLLTKQKINVTWCLRLQGGRHYSLKHARGKKIQIPSRWKIFLSEWLRTLPRQQRGPNNYTLSYTTRQPNVTQTSASAQNDKKDLCRVSGCRASSGAYNAADHSHVQQLYDTCFFQSYPVHLIILFVFKKSNQVWFNYELVWKYHGLTFVIL